MDKLTQAFFAGLTDELEKGAAGMACDTPGMKKRSKGKGKGLARGKGRGPMGMPTKKVGRRDMGKEAMSSIKAKIEAARRDPSTKANPKDTGPPGSGLNDPRAKAMKGRGFGKQAEESFFTGFDQAMGKEGASAVGGPRGSSERKNVAGMLGSMRGIPSKPKAASKLREALKGLKATGVPAKAMPPSRAQAAGAAGARAKKAASGLVSKLRAKLDIRKAKKGLKAAGIPPKAVPGR
jgi:hypothetical protein